MSESPRTLVGLGVAFALYAALAAVAYFTLKGKFLLLVLIVIAAIAVKTYVDHLRRRL